MEKKKLFFIIAIFWAVLIFGFIGYKEFTLNTGEEIILKTRPVDPRDLFRGDYVILNYEISTLDLDTLQKDVTEFKQGDKVYITLAKAEHFNAVSGIYINKPKDGLFIKGTVKNIQGSRLNLEYGIESYFVPEGRGREIENRRGSNLEVKVAVDKLGNSVIKNILIDGEIVRFE